MKVGRSGLLVSFVGGRSLNLADYNDGGSSVNMNRIVKVGNGLELTYLASERRERDT